VVLSNEFGRSWEELGGVWEEFGRSWEEFGRSLGGDVRSWEEM
jgi:hypothetical protein